MARAATRLVVALVALVGGLAGPAGPAAGAGRALYPDLRAEPPWDLTFDTVVFDDGSAHRVLTFTASIWNAGRGRLELEGTPRPREAGRAVYQNLYDEPVGGRLVAHERVGADIAFHPGHDHFHVQDFASYLLLRKGAGGGYQPTTKKGTKTGFCIEDTSRRRGSYAAQYAGCGRRVQGVTPGWADVSGAGLPEQWVDLGTGRLADGEYAVRVTADPSDRLDEGPRERERNNAAQTCFAVRRGAIEVVGC